MPWWILLFDAAALLLVPAAWQWGGWPERAAASVNLGAAILTWLIAPLKTVGFRHLEVPTMLVDLGVLAAFLWIALRSDRWWPMLLPVLLTPSLLAHLGRIVDANLLATGYAMAGLTTYPIPLVIAAGIFGAHRRRSRSRI